MSTARSTGVRARSPVRYPGPQVRSATQSSTSPYAAEHAPAPNPDKGTHITRGPHLWTTLWVCGLRPPPSVERMIFPHTRGKPVDNPCTTPRRGGDEAGVSCGAPVGDDPASTACRRHAHGSSPGRAQPAGGADLHGCAPSTGSTPPTTMTTPLNSWIQPRGPTLPTAPRGRQELTGKASVDRRPPNPTIRVGRTHTGH